MILQVKNLYQRFGGVYALRDVSFSLHSKELIGLIGPNGSGKSTLVNVISGMLRATRGSIYLRDLDITREYAANIVRSGISRTFQSPRLFGASTVRRNIEIAQLEQQRGADLLHWFIDSHLPQLKGRLDHPAQTLSLFEQKKLEIALHLANHPILILLDEPAAGLSPSEQDELIHIIKDINDIPCAVVVIEHSMHVIFQLARRVLVLRGGELIADDEPAAIVENESVIDAYLGPGAAEFLHDSTNH